MRARANRSAQAFEDLAERYDAWYDTAAGQLLFDLELGALRPLLAGTAGPRLEVGVGSGLYVPRTSSAPVAWMNVLRLLEASTDDLLANTRIPLLVLSFRRSADRYLANYRAVSRSAW